MVNDFTGLERGSGIHKRLFNKTFNDEITMGGGSYDLPASS